MSTRKPFSVSLRRAVLIAQSVLVLALGMSLITPPSPAAAQDESESGADPLDAATLTVNVELILDSSGSMSEPMPGMENQSRMDAAQAAMREVIERIPERDGLNVGLRVYGHRGGNSEEDRPRSCRSTELLVPMQGVAKEALLARVESTTPTGWTPLALALDAATADFAAGGESVTNAIIMVTDGEETCGGNPCQVAGALHAAEIEVTTHVVGFALTSDQQDAVRCIAEEGGGQLFAADDAATLSEAVFAALAHVETAPPATAVAAATETEVGGYVGGNAFGMLDQGVDGELSVVAAGSFFEGDLPIVVRNNTGSAVEALDVSIVARLDGKLVGTGEDLGVAPFIIADGAVALVRGYFGNTDIPENAEFEFSLSADPAGSEEINSSRDMVVAEIASVDNGISGILSNPHEESLAGMVILAMICFDESGTPTAWLESTDSADGLETGQTLPFTWSTGFDLAACSGYLLAASGTVS